MDGELPWPEDDYGSLPEWINANWGAVHCWHLELVDAAWAGYQASLTWGGASFNPDIWTDLSAMIAAGDRYTGCGGLAPDLQGYFDGQQKECQCAQVFGQLFVRYRTVSGDYVKSDQSAKNFAKSIVEYGTDDQGTFCNWEDVDGILHIQRLNEPLYVPSSGYWFIEPAGGAGCCAGENSFPTRPPQPALIYQEQEYPEGTGKLEIQVIDAAVDHWDIVWKRWGIKHSWFFPGGSTRQKQETWWWESTNGPLLHKWDEYNPFYEHPHRLKGCYGTHFIAPNEKPVLEGSWVTTRWISDEKMEHSGRRLRKLFRYRSKGGRPLPELSAWWANFQWEAGDTCVIHKDAWWGTPQVWARDAEEGKRVIRFAASEADIDPDQVGEWLVTSGSSPRYGLSGTMKVHLKEGFPWVSSRDGSSFPNLLALPVDP